MEKRLICLTWTVTTANQLSLGTSIQLEIYRTNWFTFHLKHWRFDAFRFLYLFWFRKQFISSHFLVYQNASKKVVILMYHNRSYKYCFCFKNHVVPVSQILSFYNRKRHSSTTYIFLSPILIKILIQFDCTASFFVFFSSFSAL